MYQKIINKLCENKFETFIVGGAVRDLLLGEEPKDYDIVTNAKIDQICLLFENEKIDLVGANFQVAMINGIEVATYREDIYNNYELIYTVVAKTIEDDLGRRDFTINSMAVCPVSGDIIDNCNGRTDLKNKVIKFTGDAKQRINEDPCRILRACRFLAKINGEFDENTFKSLITYSDNISFVAVERRRLEILKAMEYKNSSLFFTALARINGLKYLFHTLDQMYIYDLPGGDYHKESVFEHCMIAGDSISTKYPLLKLAGYLHDIGKWVTPNSDWNNITFHGHEKDGSEIVEKELKSLKFSNEEIKYISNLILFHMRSLRDISPKAMRRLISKFQEYDIDYRDFLRLKIADRKANLSKPNFTFSDIRRMINLFKIEYNNPIKSAFSVNDLAIDGNDVMKILNISPCKTVGNVLKQLLEMVLDCPELNTKEKLTETVNNNVKNIEGN